MVMYRARRMVPWTLLGLWACQPQFNSRSSEVRDTRLVATRADPAEARPDATVTFQALAVGAEGPLQDPQVSWAFCTQPKPTSETNDVAVACLAGAGNQLVDLGVGPTATGKIPTTACRQFGPDVPQAKAGEAQGRPADPDSTGGFYQPMRMLLPSVPDPGLAQVRIVCGLGTANGEQLQRFTARYKRNENLEIARLEWLGDGSQVLPAYESGGGATVVPRSTTLALRVAWPTCPGDASCGDGICSPSENICSSDCGGESGCTCKSGVINCPNDCQNPRGCTGAESYAYFDPSTQIVTDRREAVRVSWFATSGGFKDDHTGRREDELPDSSDNSWTSPETSGPVWLWVVLRDSRGGSAWASYQLSVE